MGFLSWRDAGPNPYRNSVIVNAEYCRPYHSFSR